MMMMMMMTKKNQRLPFVLHAPYNNNDDDDDVVTLLEEEGAAEPAQPKAGTQVHPLFPLKADAHDDAFFFSSQKHAVGLTRHVADVPEEVDLDEMNGVETRASGNKQPVMSIVNKQNRVG
jgi:hypothetical protein